MFSLNRILVEVCKNLNASSFKILDFILDGQSNLIAGLESGNIHISC